MIASVEYIIIILTQHSFAKNIETAFEAVDDNINDIICSESETVVLNVPEPRYKREIIEIVPASSVAERGIVNGHDDVSFTGSSVLESNNAESGDSDILTKVGRLLTSWFHHKINSLRMVRTVHRDGNVTISYHTRKEMTEMHHETSMREPQTIEKKKGTYSQFSVLKKEFRSYRR